MATKRTSSRTKIKKTNESAPNRNLDAINEDADDEEEEDEDEDAESLRLAAEASAASDSDSDEDEEDESDESDEDSEDESGDGNVELGESPNVVASDENRQVRVLVLKNSAQFLIGTKRYAEMKEGSKIHLPFYVASHLQERQIVEIL